MKASGSIISWFDGKKLQLYITTSSDDHNRKLKELEAQLPRTQIGFVLMQGNGPHIFDICTALDTEAV